MLFAQAIELAYPLIDTVTRVLPDDTVSLGLYDRFNLVTDIPKPNYQPDLCKVEQRAYLYSAPGLQIAIASSSACFVVLIKSSDFSSTFPTG
jgi:hypothetical protein